MRAGEITKFRKLILIIIITIILLLLLNLLKGILLPFLLAIILAYLLNPLVEYWEGRGFSRTGGIFLTYFFVIASILFFLLVLFPVFWGQLNTLAQMTPDYILQVQNYFRDFYEKYQKIPIPYAIRNELDLTLLQIELLIIQTIGQLIDCILVLFSNAFSILISPILAYYILKEQANILEICLKYWPKHWRRKIIELWTEIDFQLINFIKGHLLVASIVGIMAMMGFFLIKLDFPILLGLIVGVTEIIPYFGPIIGAIPALGIAILDSKAKAFYALLLMFSIQQIESSVLSPKIIGTRVGLHPLVVIFVLLLGAKFYGIFGLLAAIPLTLILRVLWLNLISPYLQFLIIENKK